MVLAVGASGQEPPGSTARPVGPALRSKHAAVAARHAAAQHGQSAPTRSTHSYDPPSTTPKAPLVAQGCRLCPERLTLAAEKPGSGAAVALYACPTPPTQPDGMQPIYNPPPLTMQAADNPGPPRPVGCAAAAAVGAARAHGPNPRHDPLARRHDSARGAQLEPRPPHAATVLRRPRRRTDALRAACGGL